MNLSYMSQFSFSFDLKLILVFFLRTALDTEVLLIQELTTQVQNGRVVLRNSYIHYSRIPNDSTTQ
jgi:hypothetical protein